MNSNDTNNTHNNENVDNHRICKRCLIREFDEKRYYKELNKYINKLNKADRADDVLYISRLNVCKSCEKLNEGTCMACGCYVELRAAVIGSKCPLKYWR